MDYVTLQCPWCFEFCEVAFAPDEVGQLVQDCEVCCRPWVLYLRRDADGSLQVDVHRGNG